MPHRALNHWMFCAVLMRISRRFGGEGRFSNLLVHHCWRKCYWFISNHDFKQRWERQIPRAWRQGWLTNHLQSWKCGLMWVLKSDWEKKLNKQLIHKSCGTTDALPSVDLCELFIHLLTWSMCDIYFLGFTYAITALGGLVFNIITWHNQVWGFESHLWSVCPELACSPRASSGYSGFLPSPNNNKKNPIFLQCLTQ